MTDEAGQQDLRDAVRGLLASADDGPGIGLRAGAVKVYCSEALMRTAAQMIQLHGPSASPGNIPRTAT